MIIIVIRAIGTGRLPAFLNAFCPFQKRGLTYKHDNPILLLGSSASKGEFAGNCKNEKKRKRKEKRKKEEKKGGGGFLDGHLRIIMIRSRSSRFMCFRLQICVNREMGLGYHTPSPPLPLPWSLINHTASVDVKHHRCDPAGLLSTDLNFDAQT